nr:hypothetical protein [uncultured Allomuricauda sp.]
MIDSYQDKRALLVGNGINLLDTDQSFSWGKLLEELKKTYSIDVDLDNVFKPFPLAFEEMLHQKPGTNNFDSKIKTLKRRISRSIISQLTEKRGFNDFHKRIASLPYNDILTTNYDYSLQNSILDSFPAEKSNLAINKQERKYSLKRGYHLLDKTFWHIHGELYDSRNYSNGSKYYSEESIMIGYEHYASYLERIQENIKGKSGNQKVDNQSLMVRLRDKERSPYWIDMFFTHDLDIVGQGFDFSENHLWWLINYRANAIRSLESKHKVNINNTIRFYYPQIDGANQIDINQLGNFNELINKKNNVWKSKAIAEVLKAFNVLPKPIQATSYKDFYDKFIGRFNLNTEL